MQKLKSKNKNWRKVRLGEVVDIIDGDRGVNYPNGSDFSKRGYCLFLNAKNVIGSDFDFSGCQFITKEKNEKLRSGRLQRGDFVLTTRGTIGNVAYYSNDIPYENMRINSGMVILRPKENFIENKFFFLFLVSEEFKEQVAALQSGSAQPQLPIRDLKLFEVGIPLMNKQKKILDILWPLKSKIELNNKISQTLEQTAQAIFKEWFVKFNFPVEFEVKSEKLKVKSLGYKDAGGKMVDSELGKIPEGWEFSNVGDVADNHDSKRVPLSAMERSKRKGYIPYYGANGILDYVDEAIFSGEYVLIAEDGTVKTDKNTPVIFLVNDDFWVNNHTHVLSGNKISTHFLFLSLQNIHIDSFITGGVQPKITQQNLNSIPIILPSDKIQKEFEEIAQLIKRKLQLVDKENQKLAALRDLLLPKLMSGEILVKS